MSAVWGTLGQGWFAQTNEWLVLCLLFGAHLAIVDGVQRTHKLKFVLTLALGLLNLIHTKCYLPLSFKP